MSRHRRRSIVFALAGTVLAVLAVGRLAAGGGPRVVPSARVARVVTVRTVTAGTRITAADLGVVQVPSTAASPHQLSAPGQAIGHRVAVTLAAGAPVMDAELAAAAAAPDARAVAVRLDAAAGIPAGDLAGVRADVYVTPPGRVPRSRLILAGVVVLAAVRSDGASVATLLLPRAAVPVAIAAESEGALRLVVHTVGGRT